MCAYSVAWNEATPAGSSTNANTIDTEFHNLKISIKERMNNVLLNAWETDANEPKTLDPTAMATYPISQLNGTPQVALVYSDAHLTVTSGVGLVLLWNSETLDTGSFHSTSTNTGRLTVTTAGYYRLAASIRVLAGSGASDITVSIQKNGSAIIRSVETPVIASDNTNLYMNEVVLAAATDYYEVTISQTSGVNMTVRGGATLSAFSIERLNGTT
jgi:hypothetical protein